MTALRFQTGGRHQTSPASLRGRKGNRTRQKNKRGDSKVESNDSPEIPDSGETSDIPGLPSGVEDVAEGFRLSTQD